MTARPLALALLTTVTLAACSGDTGPAGPAGPTGETPRFTGPGVVVALSDPAVAADGTASVTVTLTDSGGVPLDRTGRLTEGAVRLGFVLASLDEVGGAAGAYLPATTAFRAGPAGTAALGEAESSGTFEPLGPGEYRYTFAATADPARAGLTHTIAVTAARTLGGATRTGSAAVDLVPSGAPVTVRRALVSDAACAACHGDVRGHGGAWRSVSQCTLCHAGAAFDTATGEPLDLRVMLHRIHRGRDLPSVGAGGAVRFESAAGAERDYSTVVFPQSIGRCTACHQGAADDARWYGAPTRSACGSCHDLTSFEASPPVGTAAHTGGQQTDDASCTDCHREDGSSPVTASHLPAVDAAPAVAAAILSVTNSAPGQAPVVTFAVTVGGQPRDLLAAPLTRLALTLAGPTTDYDSSWSVTIQGPGASGALVALGDGSFRYTVPAVAALPPGATGSYAAALEGYLQASGAEPRVSADPVPFFFAVTDGTPVARRSSVSTSACAACHHRLDAHGGVRTTVEYCAFCHNATKANDTRVPRVEGQTVVAPSVDLKVMIHAIHRGALHAEPYALFGFPAPSPSNPFGSRLDFGGLRFPGDPRRCEACHPSGAPTLPLPPGLRPSTSLRLACTEDPSADGDAYCTSPFFVVEATTLTPPTAAACTGCHDSASTAAHAEVTTTADGRESCATCHAPGSAADPAAAHRVSP